MMQQDITTAVDIVSRREFIGGSDARIILGNDEKRLERLWAEKRGILEAEDLSGELVVQLGNVTEDLNRNWYERNTGRKLSHIQKRVFHPSVSWMAATLDGLIEDASGTTVYEAKFMLPWSFSETGAAEKHMAQLQHNMAVTGSSNSVLSVITGGGKWVGISIPADPIYQLVLGEAEREFWRCVQTGDPPKLFGAEAPKPRMAAVRVVDMTHSNSWALLAHTFRQTQQAFRDHEEAKTELKILVPEDAKEAIGHGIRARRSKSGSISFDLLEAGAEDANV